MIRLIWKNKYTTSLDLIKKVEDYFKVKLPKDYEEIINLYDAFGLEVLGKNRKFYEPVIQVQSKKFEIIEFYHFREYNLKENSSIEAISLVNYYIIDSEYLPIPEKMIPFASNAGKNKYLFDYRENEKEPAILFWDTDEINEDAFEMDPEEYMEEYDEDIEVGKNDGFYKIADSFEEFLNMIEADDK